ncbi:MAG: hypothetical protein IKR76_00640 [Ruminococcus sp.]|nr:hypothetical protein [Ruminococcus sp.]
MKKPNDVIELLQSIKNRPGMFIGKRSVLRLKCFMDGYLCAMQFEGIDIKPDVYYSFIRWLSEKYQIRSVVSYDTILTDALHDDELAFDAFFEEFEMFLQSVIINKL